MVARYSLPKMSAIWEDEFKFKTMLEIEILAIEALAKIKQVPSSSVSRIKKNAKFNSTPVIMLSSKDGLFDRARGRMVGSDEYLTKPFTKDSLLKTVGNHAAARPR